MQNRTVEKFLLDDTFRLRFTFLVWELSRHADWLSLAVYVEHNESAGKRRPYIVVQIGKIVFQSGWLFDKEDCKTPAPTGEAEKE